MIDYPVSSACSSVCGLCGSAEHRRDGLPIVRNDFAGPMHDACRDDLRTYGSD